MRDDDQDGKVSDVRYDVDPRLGSLKDQFI